MSRIKLEDNGMSSIMKLADGNPGAMSALFELLNTKCDPDNFMGGLGNLLSLDTHMIYGSDIYVLYSDLCNKDVVRMCAVLRSVQLGILQESILQDACSRQDYSGREMINVDDLFDKVVEVLPNFGNKVEAK